MVTVASTLKTHQPCAIISPTREVCGLVLAVYSPIAPDYFFVDINLITLVGYSAFCCSRVHSVDFWEAEIALYRYNLVGVLGA